MLFKLIIFSHFSAASVRILAIYLCLVQQCLNVSWDVINLRRFNSATWAPILFYQAIGYAVTAEQLLTFPARFRVSNQVGAHPAFEGIQVLLDLCLIRYPLWSEEHSALLVIQTPILL